LAQEFFGPRRVGEWQAMPEAQQSRPEMEAAV